MVILFCYYYYSRGLAYKIQKKPQSACAEINEGLIIFSPILYYIILTDIFCLRIVVPSNSEYLLSFASD